MMSDMKNEHIPISNELTENLKQIGMDLTQEQLDEIFADEEKSRIFFTVVLFCLATGKNIHELGEIVGDEECS